MTYALARYRAPARPRSMGGIAEWFGGGSDDSAEQVRCINKANSSRQVQAIESQIRTLRSTWNPTGFYRPADIAMVVDKIRDAAAEAGKALAAAPLSTRDAESLKREEFRDADRKIVTPSKFYLDAVAKARSTGADAISAPGFKEYVLKAMQSIANVYVAATVLHCRQTWVEKYLDKAYRAIVSLGGVVAGVLGVAGDLTKNLLNLGRAGFDFIVWLTKYAPYIGVGVGGWFVYKNFIREK